MLTQNHLKELFHYCPDSGLFTRRVSPNNRVKAGDVAGCVSGDGYLRIRIDRKLYLAHRLAWLYQTGDWPKKKTIDHINRVRADNRWLNLREATDSENQANRPAQRNNASGRKGVCWDKRDNNWRVQIVCDGHQYYLGQFDNLEEAAAMFEGASKLIRGEFAPHPHDFITHT